MLNKIFYNKSINKFNRLSFLFALLLTALIIILVSINAYTEYKNDIQKIEKEYYKVQKEFIKKETLRALNFIKYKYNKNIKNQKQNLKELQEEIIDIIEQIRNERDGTGYVFIYDFDGVNIADPILKQNAGKNLINFTDPNGKKVIKELIDISKKPEGGYVKYVWNKPTTNTLAPKISYAISFKPYRWMIGSGVYIDEIEKVLKRKKDQYNKKIITYIVQILAVSIFLFIIGTIVYQYFTMLVRQDIEKIRLTLKDMDIIALQELTFKEFRRIANHTNSLTKELTQLNINLEQKVELRTKELKKSEQYAHTLVQSQDKFLKNAIHEINTPLSIIITNIDLFKIKYGNNKYLSKIEAGAKIIHNIYNDLSYLVKKDRIVYEKELINFSEFLESRADFFEEIAIGNNLKIETNIQKDIFVQFNSTQLQRICDNSISNAIKYSFRDTCIDISLKKDNDDIIFIITNKGETIEDSSKIFQRYYREDEARGGFGLGLNIIYDICQNNNVSIDIKSQNHQTSFIYKFI
jgi:signal transduction histidine kinase